MSTITCNGYTWRIKKIDKRCETQNSSILVNSVKDKGDNVAYYGILTRIVKLIYLEGQSMISFECDQVDPNRGIK